MRRQAVRVLRLSVGGALLLLGVIGLFVPVLQGWLFILAGLSVMAPESPTAHRTLGWVKRKLRRHHEPEGCDDGGAAPASGGAQDGRPEHGRGRGDAGDGARHLAQLGDAEIGAKGNQR